MEKDEKSVVVCNPPETEFSLQWGNKKRVRCVRFRDPGGRFRRKITSTVQKESFLLQSTRLTRNCEAAANRKSALAEKEDRYYATRGSAVEGGERGFGDENNRGGGAVWPKLYISLSSKEKEEDFMAMKGCKLPQRPKKRAKLIQRSLLLVSPGAWLSDMCQDRYEVREKKTSKKRPRGLRAMGSIGSDSE